jgi:hypothetical protein
VPKVNVPQKDGSISISTAGDEPRTYHVSEGQVTVAEKDVERFLAVVDGSKVAGGSTTSATKKES